MKTTPRFSSFPAIVLFVVSAAAGLVVQAQEPVKNSTSVEFLSSLEAEVIAEINQARANPEKYAAYLEESRKYYNGKSYLPPSRQRPLTTLDGVAAVDEALKFLRESKPLAPLQPCHGLTLGAKDHLLDLSRKTTTGHRGSDGSLPNDRISRYGTWKNTVGEAIVYTPGTAREIVLNLIVDDGISDRPHRKNVFEPNFQVAGVAISPQASSDSFCVIDYAGGFADKPGLKAIGTPDKEVKAVEPAMTNTPALKPPATKAPATKKTNKAK